MEMRQQVPNMKQERFKSRQDTEYERMVRSDSAPYSQMNDSNLVNDAIRNEREHENVALIIVYKCNFKIIEIVIIKGKQYMNVAC